MGIVAKINTPAEIIDVVINNNASPPVFTISEQTIKLKIDMTPKHVTTVVENRNKTITVAEMPLGRKGDDGDSAYQVAVNNGFIGTEEEWLASLQGGGDQAVANFEFELARKATGNSYMEYTKNVNDEITNVDYWVDSSKASKLFTKVITWVGGNPTQVTITNNTTGKTMTTTIAYVGDELLNVTKEVI